jgi:DNA-binding transcriptional ArsR family regulator
VSTDDPSQLLLHPVRMRIVVALAGRGPSTVREISTRMTDVPPATLYRHVRVLAQSGIATVVGERPVRGAVERTYALVPDRAGLTPPQLASAAADQRMQAFTTFIGSLLADFAAVNRRGGAAAAETAWFVTPLDLTDEQFAAFGAELQALLQRAMATPPSPDGRRRTLASVLLPDPSQPGDPS